jgi:methionine-rich copper-binding protein CopC
MSLDPTSLRRRSVAGALGAALLVLLLPLTVTAHAELQSSDPAQGATVPSPFSGPVVMTFTEALAVGSKADLYGPGHELIASATIDAGTMTVSLASALAPGEYTVEWVSIADDGDLLRGTVAFIVAAGPSTTASVAPSASTPAQPSSEATNPPGAASTAEAATRGPSPATSPASTGAAGSDVILPIVIALILAAAGAFYLVRRNRPT